MKKSILRFPVFLTFFFFANHGQLVSQCQSQAVASLHPNQIKTSMLTGGDLLWNRSNSPSFLVPYVPNTDVPSTIFASALWLSGFDAGGNLKTSCQRYGHFSGHADFWPGPINDATGEVFAEGCTNFDHVWKVTRAEILHFLHDLNDNGTIDAPLPKGIKTWPGRGNPHFEAAMGFLLPDQELAPFYDANANGIYEPMAGEYPVIDPDHPTVIADEITFSVFNDIQDTHTETGGEPLGVEVHLLGFGFNCADNELLDHTLFTRTKIFKKAGADLTEMRVGLWTDIQLGCNLDNYFGFDTTLNTQYFYNKDNFDFEQNCDSYGPSYGENPPVQTVTLLNQPTAHLTYTTNFTFEEPPPIYSNPIVAAHFNNYLSGFWLDGTPFTSGGTGYDLTSTEEVNIVFPDNPNDAGGWSMLNENLPNWDFNTIQSITPLAFAHGESLTLDMAYAFHREPGASHLENVNVALTAVPALYDFYENNFMGTCTQFEFCETSCVWPGDANTDGIAKEDDLLYFRLAIDESGSPRNPASHLWGAYHADDWGGEIFGGTELKHTDFSGDGLVDEIDPAILDLNFGEKRTDYTPNPMPAPLANGELYIDISDSELSTTDSEVQRIVHCEISLASQAEPFSPPISGVSLVVHYDTSVFEAPFFPHDDFEPQNSFLTILPKYSISKPDYDNGELAYAIVSIEGPVNPFPAFGKVAEFSLSFREDAMTHNPDGTEEISFQIFDAYAVTSDGEIITLGYESDVLLGTDMIVESDTTSTHEYFSENISLHISPNPNNGHFSIFSKNNFQNMSLAIFDINGQKIWSGEMPAGQNKHDIYIGENLRSGIYIVKAIREDGGFMSQKIIIEK